MLDESTIDFYGRLISPGLTARRIFARVEAVRSETCAVKSFVVRPNGHFRGFRAGQHVNVTVEIGGVRHTRTYSPSNAPDRSRAVVLTVKRGGRVSGWLHEHLSVGDWVELSQAFGDLTLPVDPSAKFLFVAGGSGITPLASLARDLVLRHTAPDVVLLAYARTGSESIFAEDLADLSRRHPSLRVHFGVTRGETSRAELAGHFGSEHLRRIAPDVAERRVYACGPPALIRAVCALAAEDRWPYPPRTESFAPPEPLVDDTVDGPPASIEVTAARSGRAFSARVGVPLLGQAERAGLSPRSGCRQGICFSCTCRKRSGTVRNLTTGGISSEPEEDIRLCVSAPLSDVALDL